jgi:hypothetical protein
VLWRLAELNRVLFAVQEVMDEERKAGVTAVLRQCASAVIDGRMPDHNETLTCAAGVGFLAQDGGAVSITTEGEIFLSLNVERLYELSVDQKRVLLRSAFLNGLFRAETRTLLKRFAPAYTCPSPKPHPLRSWMVHARAGQREVRARLTHVRAQRTCSKRWRLVGGGVVGILRLSDLPGETRFSAEDGRRERREERRRALVAVKTNRCWATPPGGRSDDAGHRLRESG